MIWDFCLKWIIPDNVLSLFAALPEQPCKMSVASSVFLDLYLLWAEGKSGLYLQSIATAFSIWNNHVFVFWVSVQRCSSETDRQTDWLIDYIQTRKLLSYCPTSSAHPSGSQVLQTVWYTKSTCLEAKPENSYEAQDDILALIFICQGWKGQRKTVSLTHTASQAWGFQSQEKEHLVAIKQQRNRNLKSRKKNTEEIRNSWLTLNITRNFLCN